MRKGRQSRSDTRAELPVPVVVPLLITLLIALLTHVHAARSTPPGTIAGPAPASGAGAPFPTARGAVLGPATFDPQPLDQPFDYRLTNQRMSAEERWVRCSSTGRSAPVAQHPMRGSTRAHNITLGPGVRSALNHSPIS